MKESLYRIFRLLRVILDTVDLNMSMSNKKKKKGGIGSKIFLAVILLMVVVEFGVMAFFLSIKAYEVLAPLGLQSLILGLAVASGSLLIFVFGIFYVTSVFYHTSDIERLLSMPFRPFEIIASKFLSLVIFEYISSVIVLIPFAVYGVKNGEGPLFYLYSLLVLLLMPLIPLTINAIIIMPVMRFVKFARNKDAFMTISSIILMVLVLGLNFSIQKLAVSTTDLSQGFINSAETAAGLGTSIFPGSVFAAKALATAGSISGFLYLLAYLAASAAAFGIVLLLAGKLYLPAATAVTSSYSGRKKLTDTDMDKQLSGSGLYSTYFKKEVSILVRTPIFFLNNVIINFIWPVILGMTILMPSEKGDGQSVFEMIRASIRFDTPESVLLLLFFAFGAGLFMGGSNGIAATTLSREGSGFNYMKIFPISYLKQILLKCAVGVFFSLIAVVFILVLFCYLALPPFWVPLLALLAAIPGVIFANLFSVIFDLINPKLHWDNEQQAVKQNLNYLFAMFLSMGLGALLVAGAFLPLGWLLKTALLIAVIIVPNTIIYFFLKHFVPKKMEEHYY